jgi:hypothetical protein
MGELDVHDYSSDPTTFFAPITSATDEIELKGFWEYGKADLDGMWTPNAETCPSIVKWVESIGARFGRVQLLRMKANTFASAAGACTWTTTTRATRRTRAGSCGCGSS